MNIPYYSHQIDSHPPWGMSLHIRNLIEEMRQQEMNELRFDRYQARADEGCGLEDITTTRCPECNRATVVLEHVFTPQRKLFSEEREQSWYACEWCGSELDPETFNGRTQRKPAGRAGEDEMERARRRA